jgi:hypothetical protein
LVLHHPGRPNPFSTIFPIETTENAPERFDLLLVMQKGIFNQLKIGKNDTALYLMWFMALTCLFVGEFMRILLPLTLGYYSSIVLSIYIFMRWLLSTWSGLIVLVLIFLCLLVGYSMQIPIMLYGGFYGLVIVALYGLLQWLFFTWLGRIVLLLILGLAGYWYYTNSGGQLPF